jgi:hypothetical protein
LIEGISLCVSHLHPLSDHMSTDLQYEEVPESLKNVLLVMNAADILVPPPTDVSDDPRDERQRMFWIATQERMERFLPGFLVDVIPTRSAHGTK